VNSLTLTLRLPPARALNMSPLTPDRLTGLNVRQIGQLSLTSGHSVAEYFDIEPGDPEHLSIRNSCERLSHIGAGMRAGSIQVDGPCGDYAGLGMQNGSLHISGHAGHFAGSGMKAGLLEILGDAGDFAGGALDGDRQGMRGGLLAIHGNAGDRAGERMRRGLLLIGGNAGAYCGANMLAGTIFIAGQVGNMPGFALKRGTLLLARPPAQLPATFQDSGICTLLFLTLLKKQLDREHPSLSHLLPMENRVRRYCGDLATGGTGEILVLA
jgi:formylmethanofuran dehydrogenase subunit C